MENSKIPLILFSFMQNTKLIRAYQLQKGDRFIKLGVTYHVIGNTGTRIFYTSKGTCGEWHYKQSAGAKSNELVLLIIETNSLNIKTSQNGNQFESRNFSKPCAICLFTGFNFGHSN